MTTALIATGISGFIAMTALIALLLDRSARAHAWRRIAEERRWNHNAHT